MSKKILAMFMATAMAATTFFGCGSTEETSKKDEGSSTTSTDEDTSAFWTCALESVSCVNNTVIYETL